MKVANHPAGVTAAVATLLVIIASQFGLDLSAEEAAVVVGAIASIVSVFTPRAANA